MSSLGGIIGVIIGYVLILNQIHGPAIFKIMITPSLPYPAAIKPSSFFVVIATTFILGVIASKIASSRITKELVKSY